MTINLSTGVVEWQPEIGGNDEKQVWTVTDHRTPASAGLMEITATITGLGTVTLATGDDSGHPNVSLIARPGDPVSVTPLAGDYSGLDQFQRRKTNSGVSGNDALFLRNTLGTNSRYGVIPSAAGDPVQFDGGGIDSLRFVQLSILSSEEFDTSSIFVSNPVNNELIIKGLPVEVKQISVYSLLGKEVLTQEVDAQSNLNIGVSTLTSGMYLVKMSSDNGSYTKKIVKQ